VSRCRKAAKAILNAPVHLKSSDKLEFNVAVASLTSVKKSFHYHTVSGRQNADQTRQGQVPGGIHTSTAGKRYYSYMTVTSSSSIHIVSAPDLMRISSGSKAGTPSEETKAA
jgi:predicted secreted Zn-dependent protease